MIFSDALAGFFEDADKGSLLTKKDIPVIIDSAPRFAKKFSGSLSATTRKVVYTIPQAQGGINSAHAFRFEFDGWEYQASAVAMFASGAPSLMSLSVTKTHQVGSSSGRVLNAFYYLAGARVVLSATASVTLKDMPFSTGRLDFLPNIGFDDFSDSPDDLTAVEIKQPAAGMTRVYAEGALSGFGTADNHLVFSPKDVIAAKGSKTSNKADFSTRKSTNDYLDSIKDDSGQVFSFFTYGGVNVPSDDILHYLVFRNGSSPAIAAFEQQNSNLYLAFIEGEEDASPLTWKNLSNASNDWVDVPVEDFITPKADYVVTSSRIKQKGKEIDFKLFFGAEAGSFTIPAGSNITIATFKTAYAPGVAVSGAVFNSAIHYQSGDIPTATAYLNGAANLLYRTNTDVVLGTNPKLKICGRYIRD